MVDIAMRILHTSDWHLGHTLRGEVTRDHEHPALPGIRQIDHATKRLKSLIHKPLLQGRRIPAPGKLEPEMQVGSVEEADHGGSGSG